MGVELHFSKDRDAGAAQQAPNSSASSSSAGRGHGSGDASAAGSAPSDAGVPPCLSSLKWATREPKGRLALAGVALGEAPIPPEQLLRGGRALLRALFAEAAGSDAELRDALLGGGAAARPPEDALDYYASIAHGPQRIESGDAWAAAASVARAHEEEGDWLNLAAHLIAAGKAGYTGTWSF